MGHVLVKGHVEDTLTRCATMTGCGGGSSARGTAEGEFLSGGEGGGMRAIEWEGMPGTLSSWGRRKGGVLYVGGIVTDWEFG